MAVQLVGFHPWVAFSLSFFVFFCSHFNDEIGTFTDFA